MKANPMAEREDQQKPCDFQCEGRLGPGESLEVQRTFLDGDVVRRELRFVLSDDVDAPDLNDGEIIQRALLMLFKRVNEINRENPDVEVDLEEFLKLQKKEIDRLEGENRNMIINILDRLTLYDELVVLHEELTALYNEDPFIESLKERLQILISQNDPIDSKLRGIHEDIRNFVPEVRNLVAEIEAYRQGGSGVSRAKVVLIKQRANLVKKAALKEVDVEPRFVEETKMLQPRTKLKGKSVEPTKTQKEETRERSKSREVCGKKSIDVNSLKEDKASRGWGQQNSLSKEKMDGKRSAKAIKFHKKCPKSSHSEKGSCEGIKEIKKPRSKEKIVIKKHFEEMKPHKACSKSSHDGDGEIFDNSEQSSFHF
ncbi:hypothetical protein L596_021105 [Steinernema carpocapsae]|uniref:Uncharacterized protein n=1 Tax=Steinernema carpocapsae TaxID=34508 RepID=A0A4U5MVG3_STECR|nr:hypothetical protein L596_021105 [Steinernema carpocapsae]